MLEINDLSVDFDALRAVDSANMRLEHGKVIVLEGHHGAGKTSLLKAVIGAVASSGEVMIDGLSVRNRNAAHMLALGVVLVPEGRHLFSSLTIRENLKFGAAVRRIEPVFDQVLGFFPELVPLLDQPAFALSGGQAQMLAFARGLMAAPKYLFLDEPLMGLAKNPTERIWRAILELRSDGVGVLITGQNNIPKCNIATDYFMITDGIVERRKENDK